MIAVNSLAAQDFPTTKETKQDLNTNLQSKYQHEDSTTTQILNALSGFDTSILYQDTAKEVV